MIGTQVCSHLSMSPTAVPPPCPAPVVLTQVASWPSSHRLGVMKLKFGVVATDARSVVSPVTPAGVPVGMLPLVSPSGTTFWLHSPVLSMIEWKYRNGSCRVVYPSVVDAAVVGDPELLAAIRHLLPQLSRTAPPPEASDLETIVTAPGTTLFVARDETGILGVLTLVTFRIPTGVRAWVEDVVVDDDEYIRAGATYDAVAKLKPAFSKDGTVTAANASGVNDGAAALVVMSAAEAKRRNIAPLARIVSWATAGVDPAVMGSGPITASRKALERAGWSVKDLDLVEANEAFAAQAIAVNKDLGWDPAIVNVNGGAIAIGHPVGASGARVLVTLLHEMTRRNAKKGLATLCIGGGMGIAMTVER